MDLDDSLSLVRFEVEAFSGGLNTSCLRIIITTVVIMNLYHHHLATAHISKMMTMNILFCR